MDRNQALRALETGTFDLLVVGGGITGAGVAREASLRGYGVALVEAQDFASGTSSRATKLIHGGLRYLKQLDFKLVAEAVRERQLLLRMAPHLVQAVPFVFPVYHGDPDRLLALRVGLTVYDAFARPRPAIPHQILSPRGVLDAEPGLRSVDLVGGALYTDSRTDDARLTLSVLESAYRHGAALANYAPVERFLYRADGMVVGARVRDTLTGQQLEIHARKVIAAAGPWADILRRLDDPSAQPILHLTKGVHVTVPHNLLPVRNAVVMRSADRERRMMFAIPRGEYTYLGTTDTDFDGDPASAVVDVDDVTYILNAANAWFPDATLTDADIVSTWVGLRPLVRPPRGVSPSAISREYKLFHSESGLVTVGGGQLTAFRAMAEHIVDQVLPGSGGPSERAKSVADLPGSDGPRELGRKGPNWYRAETRRAVRDEMAQRLEDVFRRRTDLMLFTPDNGRAWLAPLADEMGALLEWSPERRLAEIQHTRAATDAMFSYRAQRRLAA